MIQSKKSKSEDQERDEFYVVIVIRARARARAKRAELKNEFKNYLQYLQWGSVTQKRIRSWYDVILFGIMYTCTQAAPPPNSKPLGRENKRLKNEKLSAFDALSKYIFISSF